MSVKQDKIKQNLGFTLIELLIVISIIGILVLLAVPKYRDVLDTSRNVHDVSVGRILVETINRSVAEGDYRFTTTTLEKYNSGTWETVPDIIAEMENDHISPVGSPETGEAYVIKITDGQVTIFVDDKLIFP